MPHFQIDYSANLDEIIDMGDVCEVVRATAANIDAFPLAGIRVRATRVDHYAIADGNPKHGFIDLSVRLREGRSMDVKLDAITRIFDAMRDHLASTIANHSIALSAEIRDINAELSPKTGTIRQHLEGNA